MKPLLQQPKTLVASFVVMLAFVFTAFTANAQVNYARSATATQSDNRASPYHAGNYNDGTIASVGSTPWGWLSCNNSSGFSAWVQYEWKSKVSVNKVHFYNTNSTTRCMTAATVQYWDGSSWKTAGSFSVSAATEVEYEFPTVSTTKVRFTNFTISGSQQSNPNWREIEMYYISYGPNDAGVASIDSPYIFCGGTQPIVATIQNYGINQIDTVTVNWELDGVSQTAVNYYGLLDTAGGKGNTYAQIRLGSATFNAPRDIKVWTSRPNNIADTVPDNDTLWTRRGPSLAGTFTIGGAKGDYASFASAAADMTNFGVCGPVVFNVRPGTYTERVVLGEILGASATNTITFKSAHRDSVTLQNTGTSTATMHTLTLEGSDYVSFENMKILANGSTYGWAVWLTKDANYNKFDNCLIQSSLTATSTYSIAMVASASGTSYAGYGSNANYTEVLDCDLKGGYFTVTFFGASTTSGLVGNKFIGNTFKQGYYYGGYMYYSDSLVFQDNICDDLRNTNGYPMMFYYANNFDIQRNYFKGGGYTYLYYANYYDWNRTTQSTYANNTNIGAGSYTIYGYRMSRINFFHNSVYGKGSYLIYMPYGEGNDMRNNIFYFEGSAYALYLYNNTWLDWDYNDYYLTSGNAAYITGSVYATASSLKGYSASYNQNNWDLDPEWVTKDDDHHITTNFPNMFGPYVGIDIDQDQDDRCKLISTIGPDELTQSSLPPTANFLVPDTAWLGSPTIILNAAKASKTEGSEWWVNGKQVSDSLHLEYTPTNTGLDTITLVYFNCGGNDTLTKTVFVSPIIRAPEVDFSATDKDIYTGETITLLDLTENGATQWNWGIRNVWIYSPFLLIRDRTHYYDKVRDSLTANPVVTFQYPGIYEVQLKVANTFGADSLTRKAYITVREAAVMCDINNVSSADFGTLYDDGGADGQYSPGLTGLNRCTYTISTCKGEIDFAVDVFDLNQGDYLKIYDGVDASGKPLWDAAAYPDGMNGNKSNVPATFTATTGSAYIDFETDGNTQTIGKGFAINWNVNPVTWTNPTANFAFPDTACVGFVTNFENTTTGVYSDLEWDVNNDGSIEGYGEALGYTFNSTGTFEVKLKANSYCADFDSTIKSIVIINAAKAPTPDFTASATKASVGDTIMFSDMSQYCSNFTEWTITPANFILANETKLDGDMIDVVFTRGGFYTIELTKGNTFGKDSIIKTNYIQVLEYCTPSVANLNSDLGISRVVFNTIDNSTSVGRNGYNNYLGISTDVERGLSYPLSVERATNNNLMTRKVWIDWNIDGDFADAGELIASEAASTTLVFNDTITIPSTAVAGETRMRVATNYKNLQNLACGPHAFGEFEDYTIVISDEDNTAPVLSLVGAMVDTIEVYSSWTEPGYKAEDLLDGDITGKVVINSTLDTSVVGVYTVTYSITDAANNTDTRMRTIHVVDRQMPTITLNGSDSVVIDVNTSYTELGVTTSDNYDLALNVTVTGNADTSALGEYTITYCVTDASGNGPVCVTRWLFVQDTVAPVIALIGNDNMVVEQCGQYSDEGYTVVDNDAYTVATSGTWENDTKTRGTYTITYTATDNQGNNASVTRTIEVVDTEAPTLEMLGNAIDTVERWSDYSDAGYNVADYCNDASEVTVSVGGTFENTQSVGLYTITYLAEDASGNKSTLHTRYVVVEMPIGFGEYDFTDGFNLFPNPTNGSVNIVTDIANEQVGNVVVFDLSGQEVYRMNQVVFGTNTNVALDLNNLAAGTYHVQISGSEVYTVKKLVISK